MSGRAGYSRVKTCYGITNESVGTTLNKNIQNNTIEETLLANGPKKQLGNNITCNFREKKKRHCLAVVQ